MTHGMQGCTKHRDEVALLAGGDLPFDLEQAVRSHLDGCAPCAALLSALAGDLAVVKAYALLPQVAGAGLGAPVLARLAAEAHALPASRLPRAARSSDGGLMAFARAAAAVVAVVSAALLGLSALPSRHEPASVVARAESLPVQVHRTMGDALELAWTGDGREDAVGAVGTYRVLASANPRDFSAARPVDVAGRRLVTDMSFPAASSGTDRRLTYFRVE